MAAGNPTDKQTGQLTIENRRLIGCWITLPVPLAPAVARHGHHALGGVTATLRHANKIWMLFGFELFASLRREFSAELLEVYAPDSDKCCLVGDPAPSPSKRIRPPKTPIPQ